MSVIDLLEKRRQRQARQTPLDEQCLRQSLVHELRALLFWSRLQTLMLTILILRSIL